MQSIMDLVVGVGLGTPINRSVVFAAIGFAVQLFIKPSISYAKVGNKSIAKPFKLTASPTSKIPTTLFPWYFWPLLFAAIGGLFL